MSFWSSQTLESCLPSLIKPFDKGRIKSASYELSLGEEVYISPLPDTPEGERKKVALKKGGTVPIPPGQFAFLITYENVSVPSNAIAFISMKFKQKAQGLINVSGFHVDPGYSGRLIFAVYNAGPIKLHVEYGQQLFSIWFADLDAVDASPRTEKGFSSIPTDMLNVPDLISSLPYLVKRLDNAENNLIERQKSLIERLQSVENKVENHSVRQALYVGVIVTIVVAFLPLTPAATTYLLDRYLHPYINNAQPAKTLSSPQPSSNPKADSGERK